MKHIHDADLTIQVDVPTQDLEDLIDKVTNAAVTIIVVGTAAQVVKSLLTSNQ